MTHSSSSLPVSSSGPCASQRDAHKRDRERHEQRCGSSRRYSVHQVASQDKPVILVEAAENPASREVVETMHRARGATTTKTSDEVYEDKNACKSVELYSGERDFGTAQTEPLSVS